MCGIDGSTKNLGVTMLTLFDVVIASERATFSTNYGQIGQIPEGLSLMAITGKVRGNCVSKSILKKLWIFSESNRKILINFQTNRLFYLGDTLTATEAFNYGLVTKVIPNTEEFVEEMYKICRKTASMSSQVSISYYQNSFSSSGVHVDMKTGPL